MAKDTPKKGSKIEKGAAISATELFPDGAPSKARQEGRRLKLFFDGGDRPELERIEFHTSGEQGTKFGFLQRGHTNMDFSFRWTEMPKALALFFLEYLNSARAGKRFAFHGTEQTKTLADAIVKSNGKLFTLFTEYLPNRKTAYRVEKVFSGENLNGRSQRPRVVFVVKDYLPPDCVEIFFEREALPPEKLEKFTEHFRKVWKLPPSKEPDFLIGEGDTAPQPEPDTETSPATPPTELKEQQPPATVPVPAPQAGQSDLAKLLAKEMAQALHELREQNATKPSVEQPTAASQPPSETQAETPQAQEDSPKVDLAAGEVVLELKAPIPVVPVKEAEPPLPPINPGYFTIPEVDGCWPDHAPLFELPEGETIHQWTLKNAFEGVLILGRTGSGKTSGSGATFAEAFLRSGFGGLVLTVKKGEAEHWQRLCAHCGREQDLRIVRRGGDWKLNVLAYEAQHPGQGAGLSENLTSFCRNLLRISTRSQGAQTHDPVWQLAGDQLLNATFDLFLLAGGGVTFDRLADFVAAAPTKKIPNDEAAWLKIPVFGSLLEKAKNSLSSPEDKRIYGRATDYWFRIYPGYASKTRTSITLGIFAMFDAFRGRDIPALISSATNITPESIMSGLIVVLDLPLKELRHTGLMVQSAWKYLFQTALERCHNANSPKRRPVFLWEDEGQYFFSDHDHHFQDTARSSRVCRVILTQNLPGFYKEFGRDGADIANSVFGNLNTKIFHNNSDPATNEWAAKHFGQEIHHRVSISHNPPPPLPEPKDFVDALSRAWNPPQTTGVSTSEHWEYAVRPEEFNVLRTGGPENDFMVDAYITWMGLSAERQRHFTNITFIQNPNL